MAEISEIVGWQSTWGFLGALMYGASRFSACFYLARDTNGKWGRCFVDLIIALIIGTIAATAFGSWIGGLLHQKDARAVSTVIGLLANPLTPALVRFFEKVIMKKLEAGVSL